MRSQPAEGGPQALAGLPGLLLLLSLVTLQTLDHDQKPRRLWLAKDHGECSFLEARPGSIAVMQGLPAAMATAVPAPSFRACPARPVDAHRLVLSII